MTRIEYQAPPAGTCGKWLCRESGWARNSISSAQVPASSVYSLPGSPPSSPLLAGSWAGKKECVPLLQSLAEPSSLHSCSHSSHRAIQHPVDTGMVGRKEKGGAPEPLLPHAPACSRQVGEREREPGREGGTCVLSPLSLAWLGSLHSCSLQHRAGAALGPPCSWIS